MRPLRLVILVVLGGASLSGRARAQSEYTNLQVLPEDVSRAELSRWMIGNLRGLGLPRRQSEGCLHCHVGDMEQPTSEWDFASDAKPAKLEARVMMRMVVDINERHLAELPERLAGAMRVTCHTCHAGRIDPRPLPDVLRADYEKGGVDALITRYEALRERYFAAGAFDFRVGVLTGVAMTLANEGAFDDALAVASTNQRVYPGEPSARQAWLIISLERSVREDGVGAAMEELDAIRGSEDPVGVTPGVLDGLGWRLYRQDRAEDAISVFRKNVSVFGDEYIPNESLADALWFSGDRETAIRMFENWLERHPDHAMARRRLNEMKSQL